MAPPTGRKPGPLTACSTPKEGCLSTELYWEMQVTELLQLYLRRNITLVTLRTYVTPLGDSLPAYAVMGFLVVRQVALYRH